MPDAALTKELSAVLLDLGRRFRHRATAAADDPAAAVADLITTLHVVAELAARGDGEPVRYLKGVVDDALAVMPHKGTVPRAIEPRTKTPMPAGPDKPSSAGLKKGTPEFAEYTKRYQRWYREQKAKVT